MNKELLRRFRFIIGISLAVLLGLYGTEYVYAADNKDIVCNIGSVSKTFVTTAVLQLCDRGLVDLDEPFLTYVPEFKMADDRYRDITVRMLMNHSSGLMGTTYGDSFLIEDNDSVSHDVLLNKLLKQRLKADPGEFSVYCNDGFWLLEILVERVSGKSYTEYLRENIEAPLSLKQTGTPYDMFKTPEAIDIFLSNGDRMGHEYVMDIGSGGVISTASELSKYGSSFFNRDNTLLSDNAKEEMFKSYAGDEYETKYGLSWDSVEVEPFNRAGVKVIEKGGSTSLQFADLIVAPDNNISIAVLSAGENPIGSSAMARALMSVVLGEEGISVEAEKEKFETVDTIPEDVLDYAGYYSTGKGIIKVKFPEMKYMEVSELCGNLEKKENYKYTTEGSFVRMSGDLNRDIQDSKQEVLKFAKRDNERLYITREAYTDYDGLGENIEKEYYAERIDNNPLPEAVKKAWKSYEGEYSMYNGKYSNMMFMSANTRLKIPEGIEGYVIAEDMTVCRIIDDKHAEAFVQIPCNNGRDLKDIVITEEDGTIFMDFPEADIKLIKDGCFEAFDESVTEVFTTRDKAAWYALTEATKGKSISFDRTDNTTIYVYDKFGTMVYSTYLLDYPNEVALPTEGKIAFIGETGDKIGITFN